MDWSDLAMPIVLISIFTIFLIIIVLYALEERFGKIQKDPKDQQSFYEKGEMAYQSGNIERAERYFTEHIKTHYNHSNSYKYLLKIYEESGKQESLLHICQTILELGERNLSGVDLDKVRRSFADISYENKSYEDALYHYLILLSNAPNNDIKKKIAFLYASQNHFGKALKYYNEVIRDSPLDFEAKAAMIPCLIGESLLDEAVKFLEELKSNDMSSSREMFMLAKIKQKQGFTRESQEYFLEFLENSNWSKRNSCKDALSSLLKDFYELPLPISPDQLDFWTKVFKGCALVYSDSDKRKIELFWQLGFLEYFKDSQRLDFEVSRTEWMKVFNLDSEYKNVAALIDNLSAISEENSEQMLQEYLENRMDHARLLGEPKDLQPRSYYHVPPIDIAGIEKALESPLFSSLTSMFKGNTTSLDDLLSLPEHMFELRISQVLRKMGFTVNETVSHHNHNKMSSFKALNESNQDVLCCAYQDSRTIGEVELKNVKVLMRKLKISNSVVISLGNFSSEAIDMAKGESIRLISGSELRSTGYFS